MFMFLFYSEFIFADFKKSTLTEIIYFFTYQYFFNINDLL